MARKGTLARFLNVVKNMSQSCHPPVCWKEQQSQAETVDMIEDNKGGSRLLSYLVDHNDRESTFCYGRRGSP